MNSEQIEAFLQISSTESFSKAAEMLYISQPSISARIKTLENEIGHRLFIRSGNNLLLTREGETFLPFAKTAWQSIQDGLLAIQLRNNDTEGTLNFAIDLTISTSSLSDYINEFHEKFPKVKLSIQTDHSPYVLDKVIRHEIPIGITRSVNHPKIEKIHLMEDEIVLAVSPEHPFSSKKKVTIQDIAGENLILFNHGSIDRTLISSLFINADVKPNVILEIDNIELIKDMVKKQVGISLLPKFSIAKGIETQKIKIVNIYKAPQLHRSLHFIYLRETKIDGIMKSFVEFIVEKFREQSNEPKKL